MAMGTITLWSVAISQSNATWMGLRFLFQWGRVACLICHWQWSQNWHSTSAMGYEHHTIPTLHSYEGLFAFDTSE